MLPLASTRPHTSLVMDAHFRNATVVSLHASYSLHLQYTCTCKLGTSAALSKCPSFPFAAFAHLELLLCAVDVYSESEIPMWPDLSYLQPTASQVGESCKDACMQRQMVSGCNGF